MALDCILFFTALLWQYFLLYYNLVWYRWLKKLVNAECITEASIGGGKESDEKKFMVDKAYFCLQKANRNADRNYIAEVLKVSLAAPEQQPDYLFLFGAGEISDLS